MAQVTAIVPTWNRRALVESVLGGLREQTHPLAETIVVDNGSTDGSAEAAAKLGARVIRLEQNLGFAPAVNRGIQACRTEFLAIVNNDVELEPDWLERLVRALETTPEAWFAGGKILDFRRRDMIEGAWDLVSRGGCAWRAGHGRPDSAIWSREIPIRFAPLTATLARRELFDRAGMLEERFESFLEDVEFGVRCARAGLGGIYVPSARVYHLGSATLGRWHEETVRRIARNQLFLVARHYPARYAWAILVGQALWGLLALRHGAGWAWLRGKAEGLGRFSEFRDTSPGAGAVIEASEWELLELQRSTGFDTYWRLYFALT